MSKRARLVLTAIGVIAVVSASVLGFFFFRDNFATHYAVKFISTDVFRAGEIPYWNFYDGGGQPLAGNPNTLTFYPDNFLYLILPVHVAFNLHFILHLTAAWFAMRALSRSPWPAWLYVLSGVAISCTAFYNLIVAIAVVPFAFWAAERRHPLFLGAAFGLLALAGEPVVLIAAALGVAIIFGLRRREPPLSGNESGSSAAALQSLALAVLIAIVIALPQLIAYSDIASEVERARGFSAQTVLNASLEPRRLLEFLVGPVFHIEKPHLFLSLFIGVVVIPALLQKSRYTIVAAATFFFALGAYNPIVKAAVEALPALRIARYPEKFVIPLVVAIIVLTAKPLGDRIWRIVTFIPIVLGAVLMIPIDWFKHYDAPRLKSTRMYVRRAPGGQNPIRGEYRDRARNLEPLFGAATGMRYALDRSGDGMFSLMSRVAAERLESTHDGRYLQITGCENVPDALPRAMFVPAVIGAADVTETVHAIERDDFDVRATAVGPVRLNGFRSPPEAKVASVVEHPQSLEIRVTTPSPAVLMINETYFRAWEAGGLETFALDLDRLGVMVPAGERTITLRFGRHRTAVAATWAISLLLLVIAAGALRIEVLDRRPRQVERPADEDRPIA